MSSALECPLVHPIHPRCSCMNVSFVCSLCNSPACPVLCRSSWPQTHRDAPASASWMLGLNATMPGPLFCTPGMAIIPHHLLTHGKSPPSNLLTHGHNLMSYSWLWFVIVPYCPQETDQHPCSHLGEDLPWVSIFLFNCESQLSPHSHFQLMTSP